MLLHNKYSYNPKTDLLGVGGFGRVYKAHDTLLDRDVALKMVNIEGAKAQYSLVEEIKKAINLHHVNIIKYYDVFTLKGESFTGEETETQVGVMEYIPHGDISQMDWLTLPADQQKDILMQVLHGLHYLHKNKIIHRDIKPANILIKKEGGRIIPKITDFGISKAQDAASVSVSRVIGSIPYMAPEQFDSKGRVSYNTDFWALGILVYRLFTGTLPFGDESTTSEGVIMKNIMEMPVPSEVGKIPQPFRRLVELCLVKERGDRVKDARVLMDVLQGTQDATKPAPEIEKHMMTRAKAEAQTEAEADSTVETFAESAEEATRVYEREAGFGEAKQPGHSSRQGVNLPPPVGEDGVTSKGKPEGKPSRTLVYWLVGLAAMLLVLVGFWQYRASENREIARQEQLAAKEEARLAAEEKAAEQQREKQARLAAKREAEELRMREEQTRLDSEREAEQQRQREEQARLDAEREAEEQRQQEEQARLAAEREAEQRTWHRAESTNTIASYQSYLVAYPNGHYAAQAKESIANLKSGTFTDLRDGQTYKWVRIGNQVWMAENLNYHTANSWCYDNNAANCARYGRLYTWDAVMAGASSSSSNPSWVRGICPPGWRVPSDAEWTQLTDFIGDNSTAGTKLKARSGWIGGGNGIDEFGFSALPGGNLSASGSFVGLGTHGYWWSSTERSAARAWRRTMTHNTGSVRRYHYNKTHGFSLRCVRDN